MDDIDKIVEEISLIFAGVVTFIFCLIYAVIYYFMRPYFKRRNSYWGTPHEYVSMIMFIFVIYYTVFLLLVLEVNGYKTTAKLVLIILSIVALWMFMAAFEKIAIMLLIAGIAYCLVIEPRVYEETGLTLSPVTTIFIFALVLSPNSVYSKNI